NIISDSSFKNPTGRKRWSEIANFPARRRGGSRTARALKEQTISRKDAKAQRIAKNNFFVFFASSAALRLCVECFCSWGCEAERVTPKGLGNHNSGLATRSLTA